MKIYGEMMLDIGEPRTLDIRTEVFSPFQGSSITSILYVSDLHLKLRSAPLLAELHRIVQIIQPRVVLLGGDIVDHWPGIGKIVDCIKPITEICPVWAIPGNHDHYAGRRSVRQQVEVAGGLWIEDQSMTLDVNFGNGKIRIDGKAMTQTDPATFSILCAHYPSIFPRAVEYGYDLVLAGHLHGSQIVLSRRGELMYPGAWFFRWNGDKFTEGKTTMLVSRGANDTFPIRWNCPREVLLCQIS
jgi:predicted MPP superfamily phosphohydrolase